MPRQVCMKLADFIDFKFYCLLQSKLNQRPPYFEVILTFACVIVSKLTLPFEITRAEAFTWKQRYLATQSSPTFETETSRSHVNYHAFDQGDVWETGTSRVPEISEPTEISCLM